MVLNLPVSPTVFPPAACRELGAGLEGLPWAEVCPSSRKSGCHPHMSAAGFDF